MKNPFRKSKKTFECMLYDEVEKVRRYYITASNFSPRLNRLDKLYPGIIDYVDLFVWKRITLKDDVKIPDEFLCSCKLLGLRIKKIDSHASYRKGCKFYVSIEFENEVKDCEEL